MRKFLTIALAIVFAAADAGAGQSQTSKQGMPTSHVPYIGAIQLPVSTVAQLPLCDLYNFGILRAVNDATTPTFNATAVGGGAVKALVMCNGVNWVTP